MKKIIVILATLFCFSGVKAQESNPSFTATGNYCLLVKGDNEALMKDGKVVTTDIKLKSGDQLSPNGRIMKMDGTEIKLKEGDCVTDEGVVIRKKR